MLLPIILAFSFTLLQASSLTYSDLSVANLNHTTGVLLDSSTSLSLLGFRVKSAGDFNADGYEDVIIGSHGAQSNKGAVYIVFGSKNGLTDITLDSGIAVSQGIAISGASSNDRFGYSVSSAGDVNDDGIDDVMVGADAKGVVYVIYGTKSPPAKIDLSQGLSQSQGFRIIGGGGFDYFGGSVSYAGDVNNDGIDDVVIGAFGVSSSQGAAYVVFGKKGPRSDLNVASGISSNDGFRILCPFANMFFGWSVSDAGDIDGDGIDDIIVGAYGKNNYKGAAYVIYGQDTKNSAFLAIDLNTGLSPAQGFVITSTSVGAKFGVSMSKAGDFNGDGRADVIIGASGEAAAYVIFGKERSALSDLSLVSSGIDPSRGVKIKRTGTGGLFGEAVSSAGDINGDGIGDVIIGASQADSTGKAFVVFGSKTLASEVVVNSLNGQEGFAIVGGTASDLFGISVSRAGDVNGDGMGDLIVGAYGVKGCGAAYVLFTPVVCPESCASCEKFGECLVCQAGYGLENSQCIVCPPSTELVGGVCKELPGPLETAAEVSKGLFDSGSTASRIFTMGRSLSVGLGLIAKIIQNVRFLDINYSEEALTAFKTYGTDLFEMPIPEVFYESPEAKELPSQYLRYDMEPSFLENYWDTIMTILICLFCFLMIKLVQYLTKKQDKNHIIQVGLKNIGQTAANFLVIQIYSNLDDVIFFLLLDISSTKMNSPSAGVSMGVAIFFLLLGLFLVFFHCWLLGKYQQAKSQGTLERFEERYRVLGTLFEDFKDDSIAKQSFFGILILRCVVLVLVIMLLKPSWVQASVLMLTNLIFLAYFVYQRPFKSLFDEISQYFCELTVFAAYLSVLILSILDAQEVEKLTLRNGLGKCIVLAGIVLCLGGFIIQVIQLIGAIIGICKFFKGYYRKEAQVSVFDQSQNSKRSQGLEEGGAAENSSILNPPCVTDQVELVSGSHKKKRIPLENLQYTANNLNTFNDDKRKAGGHWVNLPKQVGPLGSRVHREPRGGGLVFGRAPTNTSLGSEGMAQSLARRRKIKKERRIPNLPGFNGNIA